MGMGDAVYLKVVDDAFNYLPPISPTWYDAKRGYLRTTPSATSADRQTQGVAARDGVMRHCTGPQCPVVG